jgi:hypothetical protein
MVFLRNQRVERIIHGCRYDSFDYAFVSGKTPTTVSSADEIDFEARVSSASLPSER